MATIFVVDDDDAMRRAICCLLNANGYSTESASSAAEFLAQVDLDRVGVVITDLAMPGMSGVELQGHLKQQCSTLAVIVVTGVADVSAAVNVMKEGAVTLLEKPFSSGELLAAIELGLEQSNALHVERQHCEVVLQKLATMSDDEIKVLDGMVEGNSIKASASELCVSTRTIERHRKSILKKMGIATIPELAVLIDRVRRGSKSQMKDRQG